MYYSPYEVLKAEHEAIKTALSVEYDDESCIASIVKGIVGMTDKLLSVEKEGGE